MCQYCSHDEYMATKAENDQKIRLKKKAKKRKK